MKRRRSVHPWLAAFFAAVLAQLPSTAGACSVCMGDPNSKTAGAINAAIFLMIGFVALMLGSFGGFAWYLSRRATTAGAEISPGEDGADSPQSFS